jgi:hypothetical protein
MHVDELKFPINERRSAHGRADPVIESAVVFCGIEQNAIAIIDYAAKLILKTGAHFPRILRVGELKELN